MDETILVKLKDGSTDTIWKKYFNPELHTPINESKQEKPKGRPRKSA